MCELVGGGGNEGCTVVREAYDKVNLGKERTM